MQALATSVREAVLELLELEKTFSDGIASSKTTAHGGSCRRFCTACKAVRQLRATSPKSTVHPFALCLEHTDGTLEGCTAETRPKAETLKALKEEVSFIRGKILVRNADE